MTARPQLAIRRPHFLRHGHYLLAAGLPVTGLPVTGLLVTGLLVAWLIVSHAAVAEDVVRYVPAERTAERKITGEILEHTGAELRIRTTAGREHTLDSQRIAGIQTEWNESVREGDKQWETGNYGQALAAYRLGLRAEKRIWGRRRILARIVWCQRHCGQTQAAIESFLLLYQSDPTTQYFSSIPLTWRASQPDASLMSRLNGWLNIDSKVAQLIAASWLLPTADRTAAIRTLQGLDDPDARISFLAQAQLWRAQAGKVGLNRVRVWQKQLARMPMEIRAGPYFIVAGGLGQAGLAADSAIAFMRLPVLFPDERDLSVEALFSAGKQLESVKKIDAARPLYQEIIRDFPSSDVVDQARERLNALQSLR